jgi:hypothetical protein
VDTSFGRFGFGLGCQPVRHFVEPVARCLAPTDRAGFARQDQKGGLENIFGVLRLVQGTPAHAPNEWPVPLHQCCKCGFIVLGGEAFKQLLVREAAGCLRTQDATDVSEDRA